MTVSDQIIAVLNDLCEKFGIAINWTSENVIPYLTELCGRYITYEIAISVAWIVVDIATITCLYNIVKYTHKKLKGNWEYNEFGKFFLFVPSVIISVICVFDFWCQIFDIVTCITFPEKMIFEYVSELMKSA